MKGQWTNMTCEINVNMLYILKRLKFALEIYNRYPRL